MSSTFTMYGRQQMLRALLTPDAFTPPTSLQVALCLQVPPANAAASQLIEPTSADYARQDYPVDMAHWAPTNFGELYNTVKITFGQAAQPWGWIQGLALVDPVAGQCVSVGSVAEPYQTTIGMIPYLDAGAIVLGIYD